MVGRSVDNTIFGAILAGRKEGFVFETGAKVLQVIEAALVADLFDSKRGGLQQVLGQFEALADDFLHG